MLGRGNKGFIFIQHKDIVYFEVLPVTLNNQSPPADSLNILMCDPITFPYYYFLLLRRIYFIFVAGALELYGRVELEYFCTGDPGKSTTDILPFGTVGKKS